MLYSELSDEQRAAVDRGAARLAEQQQKRDIERAATLGRLSAVRDREDAFLRRLSRRNRA